MNIQILQLVEGAKNARGLTVVIDVFRAFSVEAYLFAQGVDKILPIGDAELAYRLKEENPEFVLAGERMGKILPGFDIGNSCGSLGKCRSQSGQSRFVKFHSGKRTAERCLVKLCILIRKGDF